MITNLERSGAAGVDSPQIWSLSDGRAGNARQADALAEALAGLLAGTAQTEALAARAPWRWIAPRLLPGSRDAFGGAFAAALDAPPPLAVGCGRQAALATRLLRRRGARVVQILDPRLDPAHWDLVVAPEHDGLSGANVVPVLGSLHPVDDAWLRRARDAFAHLADWPSPRTVLLVGGPTRHATYDAARMQALCAQLEALRAAEGGSVLATTSRRTPGAIADALRRCWSAPAGWVWSGADQGPNPYPGLLAWADRIVCTPDSVNMVSEACATRVPVHVLDGDRSDGRPRRFLDALRARGRIGALDAAPGRPCEPLRETARIAEAVRLRLAWPQA